MKPQLPRLRCRLPLSKRVDFLAIASVVILEGFILTVNHARIADVRGIIEDLGTSDQARGGPSGRGSGGVCGGVVEGVYGAGAIFCGACEAGTDFGSGGGEAGLGVKFCCGLRY